MPLERTVDTSDLADFNLVHGRSRRAKGDDHIPRPPNSFMCYRSDMCRKHKSHPLLKNDLTVHPSRAVAEMWKTAPAEIRDYYKDMAKRKAEEHKVLYPDYKYAPVHTQRKGKPTKASLARQRKAYEMAMSSQSQSSTPPPHTPLDLQTPPYEMPPLTTSAFDSMPPPAFTMSAPLAAPQPMQAYPPRWATPQPGASLAVPWNRRKSSAAAIWDMGHRRSLSCPASTQLPIFLHRSSLEDSDVPALRQDFSYPPLEQQQQHFEPAQFMFGQSEPHPFTGLFDGPSEMPTFIDPFNGGSNYVEPGCAGTGFTDPFGFHMSLDGNRRGSLRRAHWSPESTPDNLQAKQHAQQQPVDMPVVELPWSSSQEPSPMSANHALAIEDLLSSPALLDLGVSDFEFAPPKSSVRPPQSPRQAELVACVENLNALLLQQQ